MKIPVAVSRIIKIAVTLDPFQNGFLGKPLPMFDFEIVSQGSS